jgi:hypothetical protein
VAERLTLRCPAEMFSPSGGGSPAKTLNISSKGLYCVTTMQVAAGAHLHARIEMTPDGFRAGDTPVCLDCDLEVVRVQRISDGYGLGCRIVDYVLRPAPVMPRQHSEKTQPRV